MGVMLMLLEGITKGSPVSPNFPRIKVGLVRHKCDWCRVCQQNTESQRKTSQFWGTAGFYHLEDRLPNIFLELT